MIRTTDGSGQYKRIPSVGDLHPTATGFQREVATYTATGGESSINLALLSPALSYMPGRNQLSIKRSSGGSLMSTDFQELSSTSVGFSGDPLVAGEIVELTKEFTVTGVMAVEPRPDCYTATATTGQTLIIADFSWQYNLNAGKTMGAVRVEIHGITQARGVDYSEVNLGTANTNQILLVDPLLGGENLIITPVYQAIDVSAASSTFNGQALQNIQSMMSAGSQGFVDQSTDMISVPNTTIVGRAKIPNLANDLRASLGVERIPVQAITQLQNEFGLNGEPVFAAVNDDRGLIRFVGAGWSTNINSFGTFIYTATTNEYIEITFYGTGIHLLSTTYTSRNIGITVDGGSESVVVFNPATILDGRGCNGNIIYAAASGLTLGMHTVKIRNNTPASPGVTGFEILNSNASGLININPGVGYLNGQKYVNSLVDSVAYGTGVTGGRGGRVVRYLNSDGSVGQAFTAVNAAQANLTSADHTNEEVVRTYHWREFGCGRADDFSSVTDTSTGGRAFTLDDGTTTLVTDRSISNTVGNATGLLIQYDTGNFYTLTFVGCGLDILSTPNASHGGALYIDGTLVPGTSNTAWGANKAVLKVCSGLTYGTHVIKFVRDAYWIRTASFIAYQPKKPTIPATALELCDYNVMGEYSSAAVTGTAATDWAQIPVGILAKSNVREMIYVGANWATPALDAAKPFGYECTTGVNNSQPVSYTFFGTGVVVLCAASSSGTYDFTVTLDGALNAAGANLVNATNLTGGSYRSTSTTGGQPCRVGFSGIALGVHTVTIQRSAGSGGFNFEGIHIITPIHAVKSNLYADLQNTLPVGSCSLMDSRKTSMIKEILPAQKAWAQAVGVASSPTTSSTTYIPCPDMSVTIKTTGGPLYLGFTGPFYVTGGVAYTRARYYVDGVAAGPVIYNYCGTLAAEEIMSLPNLIVPVSAGVHKVDVYWDVSSNTAVASGTDRVLTVQEL